MTSGGHYSLQRRASRWVRVRACMQVPCGRRVMFGLQSAHALLRVAYYLPARRASFTSTWQTQRSFRNWLGRSKQASKFIRQKQYYDNNNTKCKQYNGRLPEGTPSITSSWSPTVKYSVYNINSEEKEALGANTKKRNEKLTTETHQYYVMECENIN